MRIVADKIAVKMEIWTEAKVEKLLGIRVERSSTNGTLHIHNSTMIESILRKVKMENSKRTSTSIPEGLVLLKPNINDVENDEKGEWPYRELVGILMYLANTVRPDISYAASLLSGLMHNYDSTQWNAAKHFLRYLQVTKDMRVQYSKT